MRFVEFNSSFLKFVKENSTLTLLCFFLTDLAFFFFVSFLEREGFGEEAKDRRERGVELPEREGGLGETSGSFSLVVWPAGIPLGEGVRERVCLVGDGETCKSWDSSLGGVNASVLTIQLDVPQE